MVSCGLGPLLISKINYFQARYFKALFILKLLIFTYISLSYKHLKCMVEKSRITWYWLEDPGEVTSIVATSLSDAKEHLLLMMMSHSMVTTSAL